MATAKKRTAASGTGKRSGGGATKKRSTGTKAGGGSKGGAGKSSGAPKKRGTGRRELIDTGTDKRFVRRDGQGQFKESDDVGRSLATDRRRKAKTKAKPGQGDRGDRQAK